MRGVSHTLSEQHNPCITAILTTIKQQPASKWHNIINPVVRTSPNHHTLTLTPQ
ncbi:hypothetical protein QJS04_geneDACA022588 [Acorus gramineus]|uniref:Uncharacterized protein n=1 Tax=Acorus gramineus TaxID=55184 RepID=A0AAV8ZWA1_ACOGR|nr:hypothetical protein QJS04_geneDACA022588 [Acorus gramineus]